MNKPGLHAENRQIYLDWGHTLLAESLSFSRVLKYTQILMTFESYLRTPFREATRKDIERAIIDIDHVGYRPHYLHDIKVTVRKFYKWLKGTKYGYPEEVRWIHSVVHRSQRRILPDGLLSERQVADVINACTSSKDRAFLAVLYDSGCRIGEIRTMRIRSVSFDRYGARIHVSGKTGDRTLRLTISVPLLASWMNLHPRREDPDAPLWINALGGPMRYEGLRSLVTRAAKRAGIKTRVHPHLLRHSRATFLANYLTEAQLCARFGWIQGSEQPGTYVHLSGRDADEAILKLYGVEKDQDEDTRMLKPKRCGRCQVVNAFNAHMCGYCGTALKSAQRFARSSTELTEETRECAADSGPSRFAAR
jgi:site-specific recombinase XerD